jgi:hypothetical protein
VIPHLFPVIHALRVSASSEVSFVAAPNVSEPMLWVPPLVHSWIHPTVP